MFCLEAEGILLRHQRQQFRFQLRIQSGDHEFDGIPYFSGFFILGGADTLHISFGLLYQADQLHETSTKQTDLFFNMIHMLIVDFVQRFERVTAVRAAPQSALVTDALPARPTVDRQLFAAVRFTPIVFFRRPTAGMGIGRLTLSRLAERIQLLGDFLDPTAVDQLVEVQRCSAMWALRSGFREPSSDAHVATQFTAMRTQVSILEFLHAYEATKDV